MLLPRTAPKAATSEKLRHSVARPLESISYPVAMLVVTIDSIPGYDIRHVLGPVAATATHAGGVRLPKLELLDEARQGAIEKIMQLAAQRHANAIVGLRFETMVLSSLWPITAFGTAVRVVPVSADAIAQYDAMVRSGQAPPF